MSFLTVGVRLSTLLRPAINQITPQHVYQRSLNVTAVDLAARKGTREKAKKKKIKVEVKKLTYMERLMKPKKITSVQIDKHMDNEKYKLSPPDQDIFCVKYYKRSPVSFADAVEGFRQINHPTMFNKPDAVLTAQIELNMQGEKKTKFRESFTKTALIPHEFQRNLNRTILVFCKDPILKEKLLEAGASHVGGSELIKAVQGGEIKVINYEFVLAQADMVTDIIPLKGIMKKKFPTPMNGTADDDILGLLSKYVNGIQYKAIKDTYQPNFGSISANFGKLDMETSQLEENFVTLLKDINSIRPKRAGLFITRCYLVCPPSREKFNVDPFLYIDPNKKSITKFSHANIVEEEEEDTKEEEDAKEKEEKAAIGS